MAKSRKTKYVILGLLMHEPLSGYDIKRIVENQLKHFWSESYGQIYPALKELEAEGLIEQVATSTGAREDSKKYTIREAGREELVKWLKKPVEEEKQRYEVILKVFLSSTNEKDITIQQISDFKRRQEINLQEMIEYEQSLRQALSHDKEHVYYLLTVLCGKKVYQAYYDWCEEALELLKQLEES